MYKMIRKSKMCKDGVLILSLSYDNIQMRFRKGVLFMAQTLINIRMDEELKKNMEQPCQELGRKATHASGGRTIQPGSIFTDSSLAVQ